jgi:protein TonB
VVLPPIYKVNIVAAPPGERAIGVVSPTPPKPAPATAEPPKMREVKTPEPAVPLKKKSATTAPVKSTPTPKTAKTEPKKGPLKRAGGGPVGGKGTDVTTIQTEGLDFPYPGYLNNIVRQIALNFKPQNPNAPLRADVRFVIHRDGTISDLKIITPSGSYSFDLEARGAVEKGAKKFGPLPEGFQNDVLPVVFSFDPKVWR